MTINWGAPNPRSGNAQRTTTAYWQPRRQPGWSVQFEYVEDKGRRYPIGVTVRSADKNKAELTTSELRSIPFATIFEEWLKQSSIKRTAPTVDPKVAGPLKGGPLPIEVLEKVAELYRAALDRGVPPNAFVAQQLGISNSTATKRIVRARQQGLLGPTTPGKRGESR